MSEPGEWKSKGTAIASLVAELRDTLGEAGFAAMLAEVPPATRALASRRILPLEWISPADSAPLQDWVLRVHCGGSKPRYVEFVRRVCTRDFKGVYKFMLRVMSPMYVIGQAAKVYGTYHTRGKLEIVSHERRDGRIQFVGQLSNVYPSALAALNVAGYLEGLLALTGAKDVHVEPRNAKVDDAGLSAQLVGSFRD